jgi:hypothetical protein
LRTARRKTGIGSSRVLARLLDVQENCDKKIDLSTPRAAGKGAGHSATIGVRGSKGMIVMLILTPLAAAGLIVAGVPSADQATTPAAVSSTASRPLPLAGRWSLDTSAMPANERPQRVTIAFQAAPDGKWNTRVEVVAPDGSSRYSESTAALDGVAVPLTGNMDFIDSVALRQPAPDTLVMTLGKAGARVSTRVYTVAKDRRSMTETIVWSGNGREKLEATRFNRID